MNEERGWAHALTTQNFSNRYIIVIFDLNFSTARHQNKIKQIWTSNRHLLDISVWLDIKKTTTICCMKTIR
jgi:hypothetical protein